MRSSDDGMKEQVSEAMEAKGKKVARVTTVAASRTKDANGRALTECAVVFRGVDQVQDSLHAEGDGADPLLCVPVGGLGLDRRHVVDGVDVGVERRRVPGAVVG